MPTTVTLSHHADVPDRSARWRAEVDVAAPANEHGADAYGGYGETPLDALDALARKLADVLGWERINGYVPTTQSEWMPPATAVATPSSIGST